MAQLTSLPPGPRQRQTAVIKGSADAHITASEVNLPKKCWSIPLSYEDKTYRCIHAGRTEEIWERWMTHDSQHPQRGEFRGMSVKRMESIVSATRSVLAASVFSPLHRVVQVFGYPPPNKFVITQISCLMALLLCGVETLAMTTTRVATCSCINFFLYCSMQ